MIAISYRREDSLPVAGRLYDRLQGEFGKNSIFMDFDSIPYGVDFRDHIQQMVERSKVLLVMIGPDWAGRRRGKSRRIDEETDFVRLEIAYALSRNVPIIPILIGQTAMPKASQLPKDIEPLAFRNAMTLDIGVDFHHHAERLISTIRPLVKENRTAGFVVVAKATEQRAGAPPVSKDQSPFGLTSNTRPSTESACQSNDSPADANKRNARLSPMSGTPSRKVRATDEAKPHITSTGTSPRDVAPLLAPGDPLMHASGPERTPLVIKPKQDRRPAQTELSVLHAPEPHLQNPPPSAGCDSPAPHLTPTGAATKSPVAPERIAAASNEAVKNAISGHTIEPVKLRPKIPRPPTLIQVVTVHAKNSVSFLLYHPFISLLVSVFAGALVVGILLTINLSSPRSASRAVSTNQGPSSLPATTHVAKAVLPATAAPTPHPEAQASPVNATAVRLGKLSLGTYPASELYEVIDVAGKTHSGLTPATIDVPEGKATIVYRRGLQQHSDTVQVLLGQPASSFWNFGSGYGVSATASPTQKVGTAAPQQIGDSPTASSSIAADPSPSASLAATPPVASEFTQNGRTSQMWIGDFIKAFVRLSDTPDVNATIPFYAENASVLGEDANPEELRFDISHYNERWPVRNDSIKGDIHIEEEEPNRQYTATYLQAFYSETAGHTAWMKGEVSVEMHIKIVDGVPQISSIDQKTLSKQQGSFSSGQVRKSSELLRALPVAGKPGIVHSPYAPTKGELNVKKFPRGAQVKCPYTGKVFIVP